MPPMSDETAKVLESHTANLMELINEAAKATLVAEDHMGDPDNFQWAKAKRESAAAASRQLNRTIEACVRHQRAVLKEKTPPQG